MLRTNSTSFGRTPLWIFSAKCGPLSGKLTISRKLMKLNKRGMFSNIVTVIFAERSYARLIRHLRTQCKTMRTLEKLGKLILSLPILFVLKQHPRSKQ
uniref:Uncharacterized protein n=1 Tax=Anopheles albimanus TaxID=7167 RepID=A0A182FYE4_ANOAL